MKRVIVGYILLLIIIVYLSIGLGRKSLPITDLSINADNPVSFSWASILIDTHFIEGAGNSAIYELSLIPVYGIFIVSIILVLSVFLKK